MTRHIAHLAHYAVLLFFIMHAKAMEKPMATVAVFPHYAVGNEWSSLIYLDVAGRGVDFESMMLTPCTYKILFYNQLGELQHELTYSIKSDSVSTSNKLRIMVPDFNRGILTYGPVRINSDCYNSKPVRKGELLFSQSVDSKINNGTVMAKIGPQSALDQFLLDTTDFVYGFAVYNGSKQAANIYIRIFDYDNNVTLVDPTNKPQFTLGALEQKIFVLTDLLPIMRDKRGLYYIHIYSYQRPPTDLPLDTVHCLALRFNQTGLFSTMSLF